MTLETILMAFTIIAGMVAVFELLEFIFTKNVPGLVRLAVRMWRALRRRFRRGKTPADGRYLILNFSSHPLMPVVAITKGRSWTPRSTRISLMKFARLTSYSSLNDWLTLSFQP